LVLALGLLLAWGQDQGFAAAEIRKPEPRKAARPGSFSNPRTFEGPSRKLKTETFNEGISLYSA